MIPSLVPVRSSIEGLNSAINSLQVHCWLSRDTWTGSDLISESPAIIRKEGVKFLVAEPGFLGITSVLLVTFEVRFSSKS